MYQSLLEQKVITAQAEFYKEYRYLFEFGKFIRLQSVYDTNYTIWMVMSRDKNEVILGVFQKISHPNLGSDSVKSTVSYKNEIYRITS